ncbi:hypothetical protein B0H21DRAFT_763752 [Amylocystis lapponica]|nr:hypothetical protein B0H21DRAFT_763752 [Amylocystis lapponica]
MREVSGGAIGVALVPLLAMAKLPIPSVGGLGGGRDLATAAVHRSHREASLTLAQVACAICHNWIRDCRFH